MLIIGAKGFAKEVLQVFYQLKNINKIAFYDDVTTDIGELLFDNFPILKNENEVLAFFEKNGNEFTIGIGNPYLRYKLCQKFELLGGKYTSCISPQAIIGNFDIKFKEGLNILSNVNISNSVTIGKGCMLYYNVVITHDCCVGDFVELSPNAIILGNAEIGSYSHVGANATILPNIKIGKNVIIGAGAVVTKDIPDNCVAVGSPAKVLKELEPLKL
jgi:sugar O-acyltransferase (sialic acid O-acetyltransferase NeuD family)